MTRTTVVEQPVIAPLEERTRARLEELKSNRERLLSEAQRQLAALDGAIAELSALLDPPSPNGREDSSGDVT
jgi:hypothetical protein